MTCWDCPWSGGNLGAADPSSREGRPHHSTGHRSTQKRLIDLIYEVVWQTGIVFWSTITTVGEAGPDWAVRGLAGKETSLTGGQSTEPPSTWACHLW